MMDAVEPELEHVLRGALRLPIEVMSFRRFRSTTGTEILYDFEPFMEDVRVAAARSADSTEPPVDPSEFDTIIISARKEHFESLFLGEHLWRPVRIHESFATRIRFIAGYQVAPIAAITHVAEVDRIEPSDDHGKYVVYFKGPPQSLGPIQTPANGKPLRASETRYTSFARLCRAHNLEEVF
jgi:hypothetical protein